MRVHRVSSSDVPAQFPAGTVLHNPVSGEYARVVEHTPERVVGELLAVPGAAVVGGSVTVPAGVVHDWWNAGERDLRARVTVTPPGRFAGMIGAVWGLAVVGRTNAKGMPGPIDAALLAEAFGDEIVFERPPRAVQRALVLTVAPIARRRGRSVTRDVMRAAIIPPERWPVDDNGSDVISP